MRGNYSSKGVDVGGNVIAPPAVYSLKIKKVYDTDKEGNQKVTKNGDPMVSVLCEIDDTGPYLGSTVWHNVTFMVPEPVLDKAGKPTGETRVRKGAGMALHFLKVIGEPWEGDFEYDTDMWAGKLFRAKLKVSKGMDGVDRNEIAYLVDDETKVDEEVPF